MLRNYILIRFLKTAYLSSLYLAIFFIAVQLFRIGFILSGLSPVYTGTFIALWVIFYFIYFLPDGIIVALLHNIFNLREKKLLHVIFSFGISTKRLISYFFLGTLSLFIVGLISSFLIHEEDLSFARKILMVRYQERVIEALPEKTFYDMGDFVIYVGEKSEKNLRDVFFKYGDFTVIAREARYMGKGRFYFEGGSLIVKMEGKYFITFFDNYTLDTLNIANPERREVRIKKERIYNTVNALSGLVIFFLCIPLAMKVIKYHTQVYYISAIMIMLREIVMFTFKLYLF